MKVTFWGAARQVTGSMHMLTLDNGYKILIDCGMDYELKRNPVYTENIFPFNPADIDVVVLTHAHIDHSGNLPALIYNGFRGSVLCTPATADLTKFLLYDSANIQLGDYKKNLAHARKSRRDMVPKPLYSIKQVKETTERFVTLNFNNPFKITEELTITMIEAGHLLGAASVKIDITENGKAKSIGFTGDLGRRNSKLVRDPEIMTGIDYLVTESTYGGRKHKITRDAESELAEYIQNTCVAVRGRLVIPAFSVGRTQSIVFTLHQLKMKGLLPDIKVFVDSPLAIRSTAVYEKYENLLNEEAANFHKAYGSLFEFENLKYIDDSAHHDELLYHYDPCIIISAAGMVEGGRIQEHVMNNIENPFSTILIAGFCAEGTLGHRLLSGQSTISIKGKDRKVLAKIASTDVFSSHPDSDQVFDYVKQTCDRGTKKVFLVHGEEEQLLFMQKRLNEAGIKDVELPMQKQEFIL